LEFIYEPEFWVAVSFFVFIGVLIYLGVHKKVASALDARALLISKELEEARVVRRVPSLRRGPAAMVMAWAGQIASHSLQAMQRSSPVRIAPQCKLAAKAGGERPLLEGIVQRHLRLEEITHRQEKGGDGPLYRASWSHSLRVSGLGTRSPRRSHRLAPPAQSPMPGFGENRLALSGLPSQSLASGGGSRFTVMFGQT
jgi:hypothetical protein